MSVDYYDDDADDDDCDLFFRADTPKSVRSARTNALHRNAARGQSALSGS